MISIAAESALNIIQSRPTLPQPQSCTSYCQYHNSPAQICHQWPTCPLPPGLFLYQQWPFVLPIEEGLFCLHIAIWSERIPSKAPYPTACVVVSPTRLLKSQPNQSAVLPNWVYTPSSGLSVSEAVAAYCICRQLFPPGPPPATNSLSSRAHSPAWRLVGRLLVSKHNF